MKKKLVYMVMVGMTVFSLAACGNNGADTKETTQDAATETTATESESSAGETTDLGFDELLDPVMPYEITVEDYVQLGDYNNIKVTVPEASVSEEEIDTYINSQLAAKSDVAGVTDRAVVEGDTVNIDYEGKKDGVAFEGGTDTGSLLTIGSGKFIDGFEDGLIGVTPGETVDLNLTFPEGYQNADLAGQDVVFTVTVNSIVATVADFNDERATALNEECKNVQEYRDYAHDTLMKQAEEEREIEIENAVASTFLDSCEFTQEIPEGIGAIYYNMSYEQFVIEATYYYGVDAETYATYYGYENLDAFKADLKEYSEVFAKQMVAFQAVANIEGLDVTEEETLAKMESIALENGYETVDELLEAGASVEEERIYTMYENVLEFLKEKAVVSAE